MCRSYLLSRAHSCFEIWAGCDSEISPAEIPEQNGVLTDFELSGRFDTSAEEAAERSPLLPKIFRLQPQQLSSYIFASICLATKGVEDDRPPGGAEGLRQSPFVTEYPLHLFMITLSSSMWARWALAAMAIVIASHQSATGLDMQALQVPAFALQRSCPGANSGLTSHSFLTRNGEARRKHIRSAQSMRQTARYFSMAAGRPKKGSKGSRGRVLRIALEEMYEGVELQGIIRSIRPFGAFVDVGSTTDGLLHISNMLPVHRQYFGNELVVTASEGEPVLVEVIEVDLKTRKFNLREVQLDESPRKAPAMSGRAKSEGRMSALAPDLEQLYDAVLTGDEDVEEEERKLRARRKEAASLEKWANKMRNKGHWRQVTHAFVKRSTEYGAFLEVGGREGLLHVSEMTGPAVSRGGKVLLKGGEKLQVRILAVDLAARTVQFSMRPWAPAPDEEAAELEREAAAASGGTERTNSGGLGSAVSYKARSAGVGGGKGAEQARGRASPSPDAGVQDSKTEGEAASTKNAFAVAFERAVRDASSPEI